jgi:hypothetical protein
VGAAFPAYGSRHGFTVEIPKTSGLGITRVCVYAINNQAGAFNPQLGCKVASPEIGVTI